MDRYREVLLEKIGGHYIDLSLIPVGSTVISVGIGRDISFDNPM